MSTKSKHQKRDTRRIEYVRYRNILKNNIPKNERFPFISADRPLRTKLLRVLKKKMKSISAPSRYVQPHAKKK